MITRRTSVTPSAQRTLVPTSGTSRPRSRPHRTVAVCLALALLAAACGGADDTASGGAGPTDGTAPAVAPPPSDDGPATEAETQTIRVGVATLQEQYVDPHLTVGGNLRPLQWAIADNLYRRDLDAQLVPALAESHEVSEDQLTWTFHLRDDVLMHDGSPFTANDVKTSVDRVLGSEDFAYHALFRATVTGATVVDDHTVSIATKNPYATLLDDMPVPIPTAYYEQVGEEGFRQRPMASGAWKFVSQELNQSVTYERFDDFWDESRKNNFSTLIFQIIPDETTMVAGLRTGSLDVAVNISSQSAAQLEGVPDIEILESAETAQPTFMVIDNRFPEEASPLRDVRVRRALLMAVDRAAIAETLYRGYAKVPVGGLLPVTMGFNESLEPVPFDPEGAAALLAEAGAEDLSFTLNSYSATATVPDIAKLVEAVAGYWQQVGIDVTLNVYDANSYLPEYRAGALRGIGVLSLPSSSHFEPSNFCFYFCADGPYSTLDDPAVDDLITRISSTVDLDERERLGRELNDLMYDQLYALPIVLVSSLMAIGPNVESWELQRGTPYAGPLWRLRAE